MRYIIDNDMHIHSNISICSTDPEQTPDSILKHAVKNGLKTVVLKPKGTEHLTPRKALFGLNIPLSLEIRKVILRFAGIFILKNHLSSVQEKFQMGIFVPGKEHFPQSYLAYYKGM